MKSAHRSFRPVPRAILLACGAFFALAAPSPASDIDFEAPLLLPIAYARGTAVADFDEDGRPDVAISSEEVGIALFLSKGDRRFDAPVFFESFHFPALPGAFDLDDDGHADLLGVRTNEVSAILGDGEGSFTGLVLTSVQGLRTGGGGRNVGVADVDADGRVDLVVSLLTAGRLETYFGDSTGAFAPRPGSRTDVETPRCVAVTDVDEDGLLDVVVAHENESGGTVLRGDGSGSFSFLSSLSLPRAELVHVARLDSDPHVDLVVSQDTRMTPCLGNGLGGFTPGIPVAPASTDAWNVVCGDLTGDGLDDAVALARLEFAVHASDGSGQFRPRESFAGGSTRSGMHHYTSVVDLDSDGLADVPVPSVHGVFVHFRGAGGFERVRPAVLEGAGSYQEILTADVGQDGTSDILTLGFGSPRGNGYVDARRVLGNGTISPPVRSVAGARPVHFAAGDFDGDGEPDLAVGKDLGADVFILIGDGTGAFEAAAAFDTVLDAPRLAAARLDHDGAADLVLLAGGRVEPLRGRGDGRFESFAGPGPAIPGALDFAVADLGGDGISDMALCIEDESEGIPPEVAIYVGDGSGQFVPVFRTMVSGSARAPVFADVDRDGSLDLVLGTSVLRAVGAGGLLPEISFQSVIPPGAERSNGNALADFDGDGHLDLALAHTVRQLVSVLPGDGTGRFGHGIQYGADAGHVGLVAGDFDGDCAPDIAAATTRVSLLRNRSLDSFHAIRDGNVGTAAGRSPANVLFVNGMRGEGPCRQVFVDRNALFQIRMKASPADPDGEGAFALYAWVGRPTTGTVTPLPFGYGVMSMAPELTGGSPKRTWNNTGDPALGAADLPSVAAPSLVIRKERGIRKRGAFFLQGLLEDPASPSGAYAVTNGVAVISE